MQNFEDQLNDMALERILRILCSAIPQNELKIGPIEIDKNMIYLKLLNHKREMREWLVKNRKQLLVDLIQISL